MKTLIAIVAMTAAAAAYAETTNTVSSAQPQPDQFNPPYALFRATANLVTCWLELPRCIVVENGRHPVIGLGTGLLQGTFFMCSRIILSVTDWMLLGFTGPSAYSPTFFPENVIFAQWNPYVEPQMATNAVLVVRPVQ